MKPFLISVAALFMAAQPLTAQAPKAGEAKTTDNDSAEVSFLAPAAELRANTEAADAVLKAMSKSSRGNLKYKYDSQVAIQVMVGMGGSADETMEASFLRGGKVMRSDSLGLLVDVNKNIELPGMPDMDMSESSRVFEKDGKLLFDLSGGGMSSMMGGPSGLMKITRKELKKMSSKTGMPAPMGFVRMDVPAYVDPMAVLLEIADQVALDLVSSDETQIVLEGKASSHLIPNGGPGGGEAGMDAEDLNVQIILDGASKLPTSVIIGPKDKPKFALSFSDFSRPEELLASEFNLNPKGDKVGEYGPALREMRERMESMHGGGSDDSDYGDEEEF